jgi:hypothetical protein
LGRDHPRTLVGCNNLIDASELLRRWCAAEVLRREAPARCRRGEKPDSPLLAGQLAWLGSVLLEQAKWPEA